MDNGWKSKKDKNGNVKHFKTNKNRKPYGVSRELAAEEVQAMRKSGYKARLLKTNRPLDLYAPYASVLPSNQVEKVPDKQVNEPLVKSDAKLVKMTYKDAMEKMKPVPIDLRISGDRRKGKIYAAVITGTDPKYGLKREFIDPKDKTYYGKYDVTYDYETHLKPGTIIETSESGSWKNSYGNYYIVTRDGLKLFKSNYQGKGKLEIKDIMKARERAMNESS